MYAGRFEQRPVSHDGGDFVIHVQRYVLVGELFSVHKQRKNTGIVVLKFVLVGVRRTNKIGFLNHGEQDTFGDATQGDFFFRQELRSGREYKRLNFDIRQVIQLESQFVQDRVMSYQNNGVRS